LNTDKITVNPSNAHYVSVPLIEGFCFPFGTVFFNRIESIEYSDPEKANTNKYTSALVQADRCFK